MVAGISYSIHRALSSVHDLVHSGKQRTPMNLPPHPVNEKVAGWWHVGLGVVYGGILVLCLRRVLGDLAVSTTQNGNTTLTGCVRCATRDGDPAGTPTTRTPSETRRDGSGTSGSSGESPRRSSMRSSGGRVGAAGSADGKEKKSTGSVWTTATRTGSAAESSVTDVTGALAGSNSTVSIDLRLILDSARAFFYVFTLWYHFSAALNHFRSNKTGKP